MDPKRPATTTEARDLICMVQYYRGMCPRRSRVLAPLKDSDSGPKGRKILWNDALENSLKKLKRVVSVEALLSYPYWKIPFTVHTYAYDKQLCAVISHNNKHIAFFSRILRKPQHNYTTTKKKLLAIVEFIKQFQGIIFGYEINIFSYHKNLVYAKNLSEYQRVMRWQLIIEEFGPNTTLPSPMSPVQ